MRKLTGDRINLTEEFRSTRPVSIVFAVCLSVSIGLHIVSVMMVAYIWTTPSGGSKVSYLEMSDLVPASVSSPPRSLSAPVHIPTDLAQPHQEPVPPPAKPAELPDNVGGTNSGDVRATPLGLGMAYGFVSSLGDGASLREDIREYYLVLVEKINTVWWERAAVLSSAIEQDGIVVIAVQHDGTLIERGIRRGTGSPEVDQALLDSIDKAAPLPPLPASFGRNVFAAPLKITAPSRLLRVQNYK